MYYKVLNNKICCTKSDDGSVIQCTPWSEDCPDDETLLWIKTDKTIVRLPDYSGFVFADTSEGLTTAKAELIKTLHKAFDERVSGSFTTSQKFIMQFNVSDSLKMQGAITLMESLGATTGYITQANDVTKYNIPLTTMKQVLVEMLNAYAQCHARKQKLRELINNAQSKEELAEITISWPV